MNETRAHTDQKITAKPMFHMFESVFSSSPRLPPRSGSPVQFPADEKMPPAQTGTSQTELEVQLQMLNNKLMSDIQHLTEDMKKANQDKTLALNRMHKLRARSCQLEHNLEAAKNESRSLAHDLAAMSASLMIERETNQRQHNAKNEEIANLSSSIMASKGGLTKINVADVMQLHKATESKGAAILKGDKLLVTYMGPCSLAAIKLGRQIVTNKWQDVYAITCCTDEKPMLAKTSRNYIANRLAANGIVKLDNSVLRLVGTPTSVSLVCLKTNGSNSKIMFSPVIVQAPTNLSFVTQCVEFGINLGTCWPQTEDIHQA
ncbi:hypothetical protein BDR26DRAFT_890613 [Obelidium mucronatum]|nr:hypothetical protein BDR26DRAFT_890613 [Obelidium mucronatum]